MKEVRVVFSSVNDMRKDSSPEDGLIRQFWSSKIVNAASLIRWEYYARTGY